MKIERHYYTRDPLYLRGITFRSEYDNFRSAFARGTAHYEDPPTMPTGSWTLAEWCSDESIDRDVRCDVILRWLDSAECPYQVTDRIVQGWIDTRTPGPGYEKWAEQVGATAHCVDFFSAYGCWGRAEDLLGVVP